MPSRLRVISKADAGEVLVRVSEARQDSVAFEIHDTRVWSNVFLRGCVCADETILPLTAIACALADLSFAV